MTATLDGSLTLTGAGGLTKTGPGTLLLSAASNYTGTTSGQAGTLQFAGTPPKGSVSVADEAVLALSAPGAASFASLTLNGGTLDLSSPNPNVATTQALTLKTRACVSPSGRATRTSLSSRTVVRPRLAGPTPSGS